MRTALLIIAISIGELASAVNNYKKETPVVVINFFIILFVIFAIADIIELITKI